MKSKDGIIIITIFIILTFIIIFGLWTINNDKKKSVELYNQAKIYYENKDYHNAISFLNEALKFNPAMEVDFSLEDIYQEEQKEGYVNKLEQKSEELKQIPKSEEKDRDISNIKFVWASSYETSKGTWIIGYDYVNKSKHTKFQVMDINPTWQYRQEGMPNYEDMYDNSIRQLPVQGGPIIKPGERIKVRVEIADYIYSLANAFIATGNRGRVEAVE